MTLWRDADALAEPLGGFATHPTVPIPPTVLHLARAAFATMHTTLNEGARR